MAGLSLTILSEPAMCWFRGGRPADVDLAWERLVSVGDIRSSVRAGDGETSSARVVINNADGSLTHELIDPPLLAPAVIERDGVERFRGVVSKITLGADIVVELAT